MRGNRDNTETRLTAFLRKFNTGVDKVLAVTEIYAVLNSHILRVGKAGRYERACCDIVPDLCQSKKIDSLVKIVRRPTYSIRLPSNPEEGR